MLDFNQALTQEALDAILRRQTVDADDVKHRINKDAEGFVKWLYSGRAFVGRGEARIGDAYGTAGGSLSISLRGANAGLWHDHATGQGGDLMDLYMEYMGYGREKFGLALKEVASEFLGDPVEVPRAPWDESAARRIERKKLELGSKPRADMVELGPKVADWKYRDLHGNVVASVARYELEDGGKTYRPFTFKLVDGKMQWKMGAPDLRPLYRIPEIATCQHVVLVEGEKCADALASLGIDATTAMQGSKAPIEKTDWTPIQGKSVVIWPDNDKSGMEYGERVAAHLRNLGCTVATVVIPADAPEKWDAADCIEEGRDPRDVLRTATQPPPPRNDRFPIYAWSDLENLPPARWLIKGYVPEGGLVGVYGPSGHNKSFTIVDMAGCVATGMDWHGAPVAQCPVLYIVGEGQRGVRKRLQAWQKVKGALSGLFVMPVAPMLPDDLQALQAAIDTMDDRPRVIILDTLARTFKGNENDAEDMGGWLRAVSEMQRRYDATLIFVHHTGKDLDKKDRGHSSLRAASDTMIRVQKRGEHGVTVQVDKQKDDEELTLELRTTVVEVGRDPETDEPITSLVMVKDEGEQVRSTDTESGPVRGKVQQAILSVLDRTGRPMKAISIIAALPDVDASSVRKALPNLQEKGMVEAVECPTSGDVLWAATERKLGEEI